MKFIKNIIFCFLFFSYFTNLNAQDFGSEKEANTMLQRAINLMNYDKSYALNVFTERSGGFNFKDLYPFCADDSGILTGHPFNLGLDLLTFIIY